MLKKGGVIWIFPGGGNMSAYACGACLAVRDLKINKPEIIVASSGGAANAFYYLAGQIERAKQIWSNEISSKEILSGARFWKMFNRDKMIDGVFMRKPNALNLNSIKKSKIPLFVGVTNSKTGKLEFISNKDNINLLNLLKATMTVPFFSGIFKDISISINKNRYLDSRISSRYELLLDKALEFNPSKILVFGNIKSKKYNYGGRFWYYLWLIAKSIKNLDFNFMQNQLIALNEQDKKITYKHIFYLWPKKRLKIAPWDNSPNSLQNLIKQGYEETMKNKELLKFFQN